MSTLYGDQHRALQDRFGSRKLADRLAETTVKDRIGGRHAAFIESRDFFFLATVDHEGRPTVSYKGGDAGVVKVLDAQTLAFPSYDGNGMFLTFGNMTAAPSVGLLFIDFETPHRLRAQGEASVDPADPLLAHWPGADLVARVRVREVFVNCPRYVHKMARVAPSKYVPDADGTAPLAAWKRVDFLSDALRPEDAGKPQAAGILDPAAYQKLLEDGEA